MRLLTILRHILSILLLPFLVVVAILYWLLNTFPPGNIPWSQASILTQTLRLTGVIFLTAGIALFGWCVNLFARVGRGTLAPWDPTRNLVALGPYRFIRNPMIAGVCLMLLGQVLLWHSAAVGIWCCGFALLNHFYFLLSEEPGLEKRFGEDYRIFKANVPRWIPRRKPWSGE